MNFRRREFLQAAATLGIGALLPEATFAQSTQGGGTPSPLSIPTRLIPRTKESLPVVGLGSTKAVLDIPKTGTDEMRAVIQALVDNGGKVIDTSWREEAIDGPFGRLMQDPRWKAKLFVATKINTMGKQAGIQQAEQTERLFNRKPVDLMQVESLRDADVHLETLREWKADGRTRYIGVTASGVADFPRIEGYMKDAHLDFIQVPYTISEPEAEQRLLPAAKDLGIAVLIRSPFMNGDWLKKMSGKQLPRWAAEIGCTDWASAVLKFILANQSVTCVLTETANPKHLIENMQSSLGKMPDEPLRRRMKADVAAIT